MKKHWAILGVLVIGGLAVGVYRAKMGAQETETRITALQAEIRRTKEDISVLKAEEAYLSRPERIGPLARQKLGLEPSRPDQFTAAEMLSRRLGEERMLAPDAIAPEAALKP
jgi:cell division protein FtsL